MSDKKDLQYIENLERAISEKYGKETVANPRSSWTKEKEQEYIEQLKKQAKKDNAKREQEEKVEINGFLVPKKLLNKEGKKKCPTCGNMCSKINDDVAMIKYECCYDCFIQYVEGRETRWLSGWRPKTGEN